MRIAKTRRKYWKGLSVLNFPISHWSRRFLDLCADSLIGILSSDAEGLYYLWISQGFFQNHGLSVPRVHFKLHESLKNVVA